MHNDDILLCHILKCKPIDLCINKPVLTPQQEQVFNLLKDRLRHGEPLQYILGEWDFCGLTFKVSPAVLVPRPETEVMVEKAINTVSSIQALNGNAAQDINILDIGTGSGCIAITLAKHFPKVKITAFDISSDALTIARDNALRHGVSQRIDFQCIDIKDFMKVTGTFMNVPAPFGDCCAVTFDLIISNPPYIPSGQIASLPLDVRKEPHLALECYYTKITAH